MPKLIFTDPNFAGRVYKFVHEKTTIGRSDANQLVIRDDSVSSRQCEILVYGTEVIVRDLDSRNGTFVEGTRLHNQQSGIKSGHTIRFGTVAARLEIEPEETLERETDVTAVVTHARAVRDQRRAQNAAPPNASEVLQPSSDDRPPGQTIFIPRNSEMSPAPDALPESFNPPRKKSTAKMPAMIILGCAALAFIVWLIWGR